MRRATSPLALVTLAALCAPAAAQLTTAADPSGTYMLLITPVGSGCPDLGPNMQAILDNRAAGRLGLTIGGMSGAMRYQPDQQSLSGRLPDLFGYGPADVNGTVDEYQGRISLALNIRWTGIDCMVQGNGSIRSPAPVQSAAAPVTQATQAAPVASASPATTIDASPQPAESPPRLRGTPYWLKILLTAAAASGLGWLLGKALARRRA